MQHAHARMINASINDTIGKFSSRSTIGLASSSIFVKELVNQYKV
jgi:hypothetical protein